MWLLEEDRALSTYKPHCEAVGVSEVVSQRPMRGQLWASAVFFTWGESGPGSPEPSERRLRGDIQSCCLSLGVPSCSFPLGLHVYILKSRKELSN